ncbi:MAG TPA: efflux RND transporter periplasmic adaptor subunit [Kofleriaceae bacterium]
MPPVSLSQISLLSILAACTSEAAPLQQAPPPTPVGATAVVLREVNPWDELTGRIEATSAVQIRPRVAGYVTAVKYREGAEVAAGSALFTIDARPYQAALARAGAELARARARVELARIDAGRAEKLVASNAIPRAERDSLASAVVQAEAEVAAAAAAVELARLDVEFTTVRAPFAGRAGQALAKLGDYVAAGPAPTVLTTLVTLDPIDVYFTGDEPTFLRFAGRAIGAPAFVGLSDEPGFPREAKIDFVDNRLDEATGTIRFRAVLPNKDHRLTPGLYARVRLNETAAVHAALVDDKAVLTDQDRKYVFVVGAGEIVERRDVKIGRVIDGLRVINDGVRAGDRVIVSGVQKVFPGAHVQITAPLAPAGTTL